MNVKAYARMLKGFVQQSGKNTCPYCGSETSSASASFFCSYCEAFIPDAKAVSTNAIQLAKSINSSVAANDFATALQKYESLPDYAANPYLPYSEALVSIERSNYEASLINYSLQGFMDENITRRNASLAAFSSARFLLNKAIATAKSALQSGSETLPYLHAMFLSYIKLGDLKAASWVLERVKKLGNQMLEAYESMVLESNIGNFSKSLEQSEKLLSKDLFVFNAAHYMALSLFKKGRAGEALSLLEAMRGGGNGAAQEALIKEIREV
ncbi:MAG: hypothetical protein QXR58_00555 [Candidatus Micrarchaeaceae archaeon]